MYDEEDGDLFGDDLGNEKGDVVLMLEYESPDPEYLDECEKNNKPNWQYFGWNPPLEVVEKPKFLPLLPINEEPKKVVDLKGYDADDEEELDDDNKLYVAVCVDYVVLDCVDECNEEVEDSTEVEENGVEREIEEEESLSDSSSSEEPYIYDTDEYMRHVARTRALVPNISSDNEGR